MTISILFPPCRWGCEDTNWAYQSALPHPVSMRLGCPRPRISSPSRAVNTSGTHLKAQHRERTPFSKRQHSVPVQPAPPAALQNVTKARITQVLQALDRESQDRVDPIHFLPPPRSRHCPTHRRFVCRGAIKPGQSVVSKAGQGAASKTGRAIKAGLLVWTPCRR